MPDWLNKILPILGLLLAVAIVLARLPKHDVGHSRAFVRRRTLNWLPLGLTYAFLYMGRYNLNPAKNALGAQLSNQDFGHIFLVGTWVYGMAFLLNGPLTDRWGGRTTIMISAVGSAACNLAMGWAITSSDSAHLRDWLVVLYGANMYFQSFGAVSIVKVNAHWFHVRERGTFSGIFGILISLGIYFAYDWSAKIIEAFGVPWAFWVPAGILLVFAVLDWLFVHDLPSGAGQKDFDTGEASLTATGEALPPLQVARRLLTNPVLVTIAVIEFFSGYLRQAVMQWGPIFAKQTGVGAEFVYKNWGMMLCIAGILGGVVAGTVSDHLFQSRRGPSAVLFYAVMLLLAIGCCFLIGNPMMAWMLVAMSMCIIGVHGLLSGTASMDFAGKRNTGLAVGIIDGFVYLGSGLQSLVIPLVVPADLGKDAAGKQILTQAADWNWWPVVIVPAALLGFLLSLRLWNARTSASGVH